MSRTLSKILVVCAMVVVFPLMIVGTAMAAYVSVDATVNVATYAVGEVVNPDGGAFYGVEYDGKRSEKRKIENGQTKTIELQASALGYSFEGWFEGTVNKASSAKKISDKETLKIKMTDYKDVFAKFSVKTYDFTLTVTNPTNPSNEGAQVSQDFTGKTYGETLPNYVDILPDSANLKDYEGFAFAGWELNGTTYNYVSFDQSIVDLKSKWVESKKVTVNYYNGETLVKTEDVYTGAAIKNPMEMGLTGVTFKSGYTYSWKNGVETPSTIPVVADGVTEIRLDLAEEAVEYTATLAIAAEDGTFNEKNEVTFTVENQDKLKTFVDAANYATKYNHIFKFENLTFDETIFETVRPEDKKFNETTLNAASDFKAFAETFAAVEGHKHATATVAFTAVIKDNFTNITLKSAKFFDMDGFGIYQAGNNNEYTYNISGEVSKPTTSTLYQFASMIPVSGGELQRFYSVPLSSGNQNETTELFLKDIYINGIKVELVNGLSGESSMYEILNKYLEKYTMIHGEVTETPTFTIDTMILHFGK